MDKLTRRNFIFGLSKFGIVSGIIDSYFDQIILGRISKLLAQSSGTSLNYIGLYLPLAPSRWMFDGVLDQGSENPYVGTKLERDSSGALKSVYELTSDMPPIWQHLSTLKDKSVMIRGVESLPIHGDKLRQFTPRPGAPGMHALASINNATFPVANAQWGILSNLNHPNKRVSLLVSKTSIL